VFDSNGPPFGAAFLFVPPAYTKSWLGSGCLSWNKRNSSLLTISKRRMSANQIGSVIIFELLHSRLGEHSPPGVTIFALRLVAASHTRDF
jgi:hypothetical protein